MFYVDKKIKKIVKKCRKIQGKIIQPLFCVDAGIMVLYVKKCSY